MSFVDYWRLFKYMLCASFFLQLNSLLIILLNSEHEFIEYLQYWERTTCFKYIPDLLLLPPRYNWNSVESGVRHHKPTNQIPDKKKKYEHLTM